jgi:hypothetical protein
MSFTMALILQGVVPMLGIVGVITFFIAWHRKQTRRESEISARIEHLIADGFESIGDQDEARKHRIRALEHDWRAR